MAGVFNADEATALLRTRFMPGIMDTIFKSNPLFATLYKKREVFAGGRTLTHELLYEADVDGEGGEFDISDESFSTQTNEAFNVSQFSWRAYQYPIKVHMIRLAEFGDDDTRAINLLSARSQRAAMALSQRLGKHLFKSAGVGPKQILSLNDAFSRTNTYGGIDRSQSANSWWLTGQVNMDSSGGSTATALTLRAVHDAIEEATEGTIRPEFGITDTATYSKIWSLAVTNQRYSDTRVNTAYLGFRAIEVDGVPILKSKLADNDGVDGSGNTKSKIRFLNTDFWKFATHKDYNFAVRPFQELNNNSPVWIARIFWFGNVYCINPRYQSELININAAA